MTIVTKELPDEVVVSLQGGQCVVLATVTPEGYPITTTMSWVVALDNRTLVFAVDQRGRALQNIRTNAHVALEVLADRLTYGCRGEASIASEHMQTPPFPSARVIMSVVEVRNHASPGVLFQGPSYLFTKNKEAREALEQAIFAELRAVGPPSSK